MTLGQQQEEFSYCLGRLLVWAHRKGFHVRGGEWHRPPAVAEIYAREGKGIANSLHSLRLAVDLFLIVKGKLSNDAKDYAPLATYWKSLSPLARWGGDFVSRVDPYHFSLTYEGRA